MKSDYFLKQFTEYTNKRIKELKVQLKEEKRDLNKIGKYKNSICRDSVVGVEAAISELTGVKLVMRKYKALAKLESRKK